LDSNLRSADAELQQRASEYLALSKIPSLDVLATVLEEMPPFPEKESSGLLNLLKKKRPGRVPDNPEISGGGGGAGSKSGGNSEDSTKVQVNVSSGGGDANASADLLGLGLGGSDSGSAPATNGNGTSEPVNNLSKFYCKNNGVLYEDETVQIGIKTECRTNLARMALFYGNKTGYPFINFQPNVTCSAELSHALSLQVKSVDSTVEAGAQFQQMVNLECIADFSTHPDLTVSFTVNGRPQKINLKIPASVNVNKFMEPTEMNGDAFFTRWKNLSIPSQESQKIFRAAFPMDATQVKTKLIGYGFSLLEGIDPNAENYVCAGIIHTKTIQIGCLLRLEPNSQAQMYRLTVRSSKDTVSQHMAAVLAEQF